MSTEARTRRRLPSEIFDLPVEKMREGYYSDAYFVFTKQVLERDGHHPRVLMQVFQRHQSVLGGMDEAIAVLRECSGRLGPAGEWLPGWDELVVHALHDGDEIEPWETVMTIEGDYSLFCHLETVYLGTLSRRTLIARNVREVVRAARGKPILYFPARHDHHRVQTGDGYAAHIAGAIGVSTDAQASWWGGRGMGTVPHGLIAAYGGDTVLAARRFVETLGSEMDVIVLVDFDNDCVGTAVAVARALGPQLWGVRLDTSATMVDRSLSPQMGRFDPRGVNPQLVRNVREALDREGFSNVRIVASGGFNVAKIASFEEAAVPVDAYGVGSALIRGENDFTADVVVRDGHPAAKAGRGYLPNPRLGRVSRPGPVKLGGVPADKEIVLTANIATAIGDLLDHIRVIIILWGPPLLLGILVYLMWRLVKMMPRTSPSELKPDSESIVRWHDVAGVEEAKAELAEIIEFLRDPVRFERLGARVPRGVLLHGPPGTGKTLLAKAVAAESGAAFFSQPASAFVEMFAGLGASRIRKLFETARKHAPAIIFIDELDAVGAARQNVGHNREQDQTLNQLLVELDGFNRSDVVIMASTNRLDTLDPALLRPGRFDRQVYVSPPDLIAREQILNVHVRNKPIDDSVELTSIARATAGLTGADLENICNEAAIRATRADRLTITNVDFDDALERVVAGLKTHRTVSEDEKRVIAYHEAGHAVLAHIVGRGMTIHKVTIVPRGGALGYNMYLPTDERVLATRDDLITRIVVLLGGRAGEQVALGVFSNGASDDLERSTAIARAMVFDWGLGESMTTRTVRADNFALSEDTKRRRDEEQSQICDYAYAEALRLLEEHRDALERLASKLLERETLDREDVATMLHDVQRVGTLAFGWPDGPTGPGLLP